ncbi:hypothetical protein RR46_05040 [Papilio xuthus]|uniref:Uncharacterized protein n=1 Tax=Papilio xuthus TaxID=66420 RepID=A0A194Q0H4_PAPXU|nr:hypothetical protein RR46_05040 [Papilio xuthus]
MAGVAMRGCARSTDTEFTQTEEHFENEEKILNGKISCLKNGYQKTANLNNEATERKVVNDARASQYRHDVAASRALAHNNVLQHFHYTLPSTDIANA